MEANGYSRRQVIKTSYSTLKRSLDDAGRALGWYRQFHGVVLMFAISNISHCLKRSNRDSGPIQHGNLEAIERIAASNLTIYLDKIIMQVSLLSTAVFRTRSIEDSINACDGILCDILHLIGDFSVLILAIVSGLVTITTLSYIRDAREACQQEQGRVIDEYAAFTEFADRIECLDSCSDESHLDEPPGSLHRNSMRNQLTDVSVQRVLRSYYNTIMAVSHYDTEYNEPIAENMCKELGPDVVTALGSNKTVPPSTQQALMRRSREAASARESLSEAIETELDALVDISKKLAAIDQRRRQFLDHLADVDINVIGGAIDIWSQLQDLESELEAVARQRQQSLHDPPIRTNPRIANEDSEMGFYNYLHGPTSGPDYPVLAEVTILINKLDEDINDVEHKIATSKIE